MKYRDTSTEGFKRNINNKKLIAFGASEFLQVINDNYSELNLESIICYIVDNDLNKVGKNYILGNSRKEIRALEWLINCNHNEYAILIASERFAYEIFEQLNSIKELDDIDCFCLPTIIMNDSGKSFSLNRIATYNKIPKRIHCFWFSGEEKDSISRKCIESWKKHCPDYEIVEWNASNYDVEKNEFTREAFKACKWAYVTDYARLDVIYNYGGVYLDFDVELLKNIDELLEYRFWAGFGPIRDVELAAFGAEKGNDLVEGMLEIYKYKKFDANAISLRSVQPLIMDSYVKSKGFLINGEFQNINNNILLPRNSFSPRNWFTGEIGNLSEAYGIHHCNGSWNSNKENVLAHISKMKKLEQLF